jgi:exodeoxyribonuclease V gamma subunit
MRACRQGLAGARPWPTAVRTGVAALQADSAFGNPVRQAFEGSDFSSVPGEGAEACLARLFPDADSLFAEPGFLQACRALYGAYAEWLAHSVTLEELPGQQAGADEDDEAEQADGSEETSVSARSDTASDAGADSRSSNRSDGSSRRSACA